MIKRSSFILTVLTIPILLGVLLSTGLFLAIPVHAHGVGKSLEKVVEEYLIDVGYDSLELRAQESVRFDFSLWTSNQGKEISFTDIWLRISQNNKVFFAGGIQSSRFGKTGITYTFPKKGEYTLFVRYQNGDSSLVETSFPLTIEEGDNAGSTFQPSGFLTGTATGLAAGALLAFFLRRSRPQN